MAKSALTSVAASAEKSALGEMSQASARRLRDALTAAGLRYTTQRAAVFAYLDCIRSHPTAEEIYQAVRDDVPQISLATVYNALDTLVAVKLATRIDGAHHTARYDATRDQHYHLRDTATGEIRDLDTRFDPELLDRLDPKLRDRLAREGFSVSGYRLEVLGKFRK
jgi:Fe2+ or Zn2+ uptake regulation protein